MQENNGTPEYDFDSINVDETISEHDINKAIFKKVPGSFVCVVGKPKMTTKTTSDFTSDKGVKTVGYMSYAVDLSFEVLEVLKLEKPILDEGGKPIERDGEPAMRKTDLTETEKAEQNALQAGMVYGELIRMFHPDEKPGTATKRLKAGVALGIVKPGVTVTAKDWGSVEGVKLIINTSWNTWKKDGVIQKSVQIDFFDGFEVYIAQGQPQDQQQAKKTTDFGGI